MKIEHFLLKLSKKNSNNLLRLFYIVCNLLNKPKICDYIVFSNEFLIKCIVLFLFYKKLYMPKF